MDGGVRRGYCETGSHDIDIAPTSVSTMEMTIVKRGRSMKMRENVLISSIDLRMPGFIYAPRWGTCSPA